MPLRNAQLDEHRSRIGMVMPDVGDTKLYQKVVGGIKIGYSGHVPRAQSHAFTSSMGGVAAAEERGTSGAGCFGSGGGVAIAVTRPL